MLYIHNTARKINKLLYKSINYSSSFFRIDAKNDNITSTTSSNNTNDPSILSDVDLSFSFQFWFSLAFHIPSIICYLFVLTYILSQKTQRQALHNHSIIVLLIVAFTLVIVDYSWTIDSFRHEGNVWLHTSTFCEVWWLFDFGFFDACTFILAWTSFERHILIFHSNLIATKRRRIFIHYLPLILILIYLIIFYIYTIFFPPCENEYDFTLPTCGAYPCYFDVSYLAMWYFIVHGIIPTLLIVLFNVVLLARVLWQKRHHPRNWKKCRRMTFQLLSISALYLSLNLPLMITFIVQIAGYPEWGVQAQHYLYFFTELIQYLLPFVCLTCLPNILLKMKSLFTQGDRRVMPMMTDGRTLRR